MNSRKVVLSIADAHDDAGLGHLARSTAVAVALRAKGLECRCIGLNAESDRVVDGIRWEATALERVTSLEPGADLAIIDSYAASAPVLTRLASRAAWFLDQGKPPDDVALIIAPAYRASQRREWLTGLSYACLRPGYWGIAPAEPKGQVERVLIATGAGDCGDAARILVSNAREAAPAAEIRRVRGPNASELCRPDVIELAGLGDLRTEMARSDLVVCLAGQTMLEAVCHGLPTVVAAPVSNQRSIARCLERTGAIVLATLDSSLGNALRNLVADSELRKRMSRESRAAVDGFGALRVASAIESLLLSG